MKPMVAVLTLITAVAMPAMASAANFYQRTNPASHPSAVYRGDAYGAYGEYYGPGYLDRDPDPRIQSEIRRDPPDDR